MTAKPRKLKPVGEPWYKNGLSFTCTQCGECCRGDPGYVWVTVKDVALMAKEFGMSPEEFFQRHVRQVEGGYSLKELPNGDCVMYEEGTDCLVYRARPVQCRTFPFWPEYLASPKAWKRAAQRCPAIDKGKLHTLDDIERNLKLLRDVDW